MSQDDRRNLLRRIQQSEARPSVESPELQQAREALRAGQLERARELLVVLQSTSASVSAVQELRRELEQAEARKRHQESLRATEDMLGRYLQQRKKKLAELALQSLAELAPNHPRLEDYRQWIAELDQEVAQQAKVEEELGAGRTALKEGNAKAARRHLDTLRKLAADAPETEQLGAELAAMLRGQEASAGISRLRRDFDEQLGRQDLASAERTLQQLARLDVAKVSQDFLRQRLDDAVQQQQESAILQKLEARFAKALDETRWAAARDVAHEVGAQFPGLPRATEMFGEIEGREGRSRREQSIAQGIATLESFIAHGQRQQAELTLKVLERLDLDPGQLALFRQRVQRI